MTDSVKMEGVLITGVTGSFGSRVDARWDARGGEVRGLVRPPIGIPGVEAGSATCSTPPRWHARYLVARGVVARGDA